MEIALAQRVVCEQGKALAASGLTAGSWGNISCRADAGRMVITPSGLVYDRLSPDDMTLMDIDDLSWQGKYKPSSEYRLHAAVYQARPEVNAVIHTHSLYAGMASVLGREIPPYLEDTAMLLGASVRLAPRAAIGSAELAAGAAAALDGRFAVLLPHHGAVCVGRDMDEAFLACQLLERSCQTYITLLQIGGGTAIEPEEAQSLRELYLHVYQQK